METENNSTPHAEGPLNFLDQIVDCNCGSSVPENTILDIAANSNIDDLHQYFESGWKHFIQKQRDHNIPIPAEIPDLLHAGDPPFWSRLRSRFCIQKDCCYSPNFTIFQTLDPEPEFCTPLTATIRSQSIEKVDLLLNLGSNPDGFELSEFEEFQALFLRFRPEVDLNVQSADEIISRDELLAEIDIPQTAHITEEEVEERRIEEFWTGHTGKHFHNRYHQPTHPLIIAAGIGSIEIIDRLLSTKADRSLWMADPPMIAIPEPPSPSTLALSSPIHEAITNGSMEMLRHLLSQGFNPNVLPLGNIVSSITPLMATILDSEPWNEAAYNILAHDPRIDFHLRTPYMLVHILHVATAHSLQVLQRVERDIPLRHSDTTAYGHTLLHIACLPTLVQTHASKARESIHNVRFQQLRMRDERGFLAPVEPLSVAQCEAEFPAQLELLRYLLASNTQSVVAYDSDLNTSLHYLAGARVINEEAIEYLRTQPDGDIAWREMKNWYGYTAEEIYEQAHRTRVRKDPWYGGTTRKVVTLPPLRM